MTSIAPTELHTTFADIVSRRFAAMWRAGYGAPCPASVTSLLDTMITPWGGGSIRHAPAWPSDIGNDHSPFEASAAFAGSDVELRLLVEAQGSTPSLRAMRDAGLALNQALARRGADLARFERVRDLFLPDVLPAADARFALWHAVTIAPGPVQAKAYLNPQIRGVDAAADVVQKALDRLDLGDAWSLLEEACGRRPSGRELKYFALDLAPTRTARVKVYLYPEHADAEFFEQLASTCRGYVPGEVTGFVRTMTGTIGPFVERPLCAYVAFTGGDAIPSDVTLQIPMSFYAPNDAVARDRVRSYLSLRGQPTTAYERVLAAATDRELAEGAGLHTYVSLRTGSSPPRITTYLAAELFRTQPPAPSSRRSMAPPRSGARLVSG